MTQQEFDAAYMRLKAQLNAALAQIRKERDTDTHYHNKAVRRITAELGENGGNQSALLEIRQLLYDGFFFREQLRKDHETNLHADHARQSAQVLAKYSQWLQGRESNRKANKELFAAVRDLKQEKP